MADKLRLHHKEKAELGVYGYMRENINKIKCIRMPQDLVQLITIWYGTIDYWDMDSMHATYAVNEENNGIQRRALYDGLSYQSYGSLNIKAGDIKLWKLQLLDIDPLCSAATTLFGIIEDQKVDANLDGDFCDRIHHGYGVSFFKGRKYHKIIQGFGYAESAQINDIIIMELDMTNPQNCTLKYKINRNGTVTDYGFAFQKIDPNKQWRLAIGMYYRDNVRLIQ